jgi:hypothetical protein
VKIIGFDIANYFIRKRIVGLQSTKKTGSNGKKNPVLQKLIDTLNLVQVK